MSYNIKQKLIDNINAIKVATFVGYSPYTEEQKLEIISKFSGFGGLKGVLNNWDVTKEQWIEDGATKQDISLYENYQELFETIRESFPFSEHKKVMESVRNATLTSFYTPSVIPRTFYDVLSQYLTVDTLYEPCAGSGVFITTALEKFPEMKLVEVCEKDKLTNKLLSISLPPNIGKTRFYIQEGFEDTDNQMDGKFDVLATNPPYGDFKIYDPEYEKDKLKRDFCKKIHNYFVAKSIDKVRDQGVCAWLITDSLLNTVSNKSIRRYLFERCDFISLTIMPDNLFLDIGGTMAPSHFLVVQKNSNKVGLSPEEELLIESNFVQGATGKYARNSYLEIHGQGPQNTICTSIKEGKNQYGKPAIEVKWDKSIEEIAEPFREILSRDFEKRFKKERTLVETFQELGKIMGATLLTITEDNNPLDERNAISGISKEMMGMDKMFKPRSEWNEEIIQFDNPKIEGFNGIQKHDIINQEPVPELKEMLPEYIPFKDGIIVEYDTDRDK